MSGRAVFWRWLTERRLVWPLVFLAVGGLLLAAFWALRGNTAAMEWWLQKVSMPYKRAVSGLVDGLPFSAAELLCTLGALALLAFLGRGVYCLAAGRPAFWPARLGWLLAAVVWCYCLSCAFWGTQYYGVSYQAKTGIYAQPIERRTLTDTTRFFRDRMNEAAGAVERDQAGRFAVSREEIFSRGKGLYDALTPVFPCLAGPERRPKPAFYSLGMSYTGFTGYIFALTGETTLNVDCPPVLLPATIAHEQSHQRGVAPEQEANFWAVVASTTCGDPVYAYSGWMYGYIYLSNALFRADPEAALDISAGICPEAAADLQEHNAYWERFEGPVKEAAEKSYSAYIEGYGQTLGMESYGACVDLLVAFYGPVAADGIV